MKPRLLSRVFRFVLSALGVAAALCVICLLVARFVLLPQLEANPQKVADFVGRQIGQPVALEKLDVSWYGWNPQFAVQGLRIYHTAPDAHTASDEAQLALPQVTVQVSSLASLLHFDVRFKVLRIERPTLVVQRDAQGQLFVGGVLIKAASQTEGQHEKNAAFSGWLMRQKAIEIVDGTLEWRDESRQAPPLIIESFNFRGEQNLAYYRFGFRGDMVSEFGTTFEGRGETATGLLQSSFDHDWQFYVRLNRADLGGLRQWIEMPIEVVHGRGSVQVWATVSRREIKEVTADVALHDVKMLLAPDEADVTPLELTQAYGRFAGRHEAMKTVLSTQGLSFIEKNGARLESTDVTLTLEGVNALSSSSLTSLLEQAQRGQFEFNRLDLPVLAGLARYVSLPPDRREMLAKTNLQGVLENGGGSWTRAPGKKDSSGTTATVEGTIRENTREAAGEASAALPLTGYSAHADMRGLGVDPVDAFPGVRGVSGRFSFDETQGALHLTGRSMAIDLPHIFEETLQLDTVEGEVLWTHPSEGLRVALDNIRFANADTEGTLEGHWQATASGPGVVDLKAQLQRATVNQVYRYLPRVAGSDTRHWLQESLKSGEVSGAQMTLKGELAHFPFAGGKHGTFVVDTHATGVRMVYDPAWPAIDGIEANVRFEGEGMTITAKRGTILGTAMGPTQAVIPNLGADHPHLLVDGTANGPMATYLRFLDESPVGAWLDHMLSGTQGTGNGKLALKLDIPLNGSDSSKVSGSFQMADNTIEMPGVPQLTHVQGAVAFTEHDVRAERLAFQALGGAGEVALTSRSEGGIALSGKGTADLSTLKTRYSIPLTERLSGETGWQLKLKTGKEQEGLQWTLDTSLAGVAIDLPEPLGKSAASAVPLRITHNTLKTGANQQEERWRIDYQLPAQPLQIVARRVLDGDGKTWQLERALINAGDAKTVALPDAPGWWARGTLSRLNTDPWFALYKALPDEVVGSVAPGTPALGGVDIKVAELGALGRQLHDARISVRKAKDAWNIGLNAHEAEGNVVWEDAASSHTPNGRLKGMFTRLTFPETGELSSWNERLTDETSTHTSLAPGSANPWPAIDFVVDHFFYKEQDLGNLSIKAVPQGTDWHMESVVLHNPEGGITADGWWRTAGKTQRTEINVQTRVSDAEKFMKRFGIPKSVVASDVQLDGTLSWADAPSDFDIRTLDGQLTLKVGLGHFTKIEPGIGRLLGVLSLQALPRRITLDFRDVFSEGFAFDSITGTTQITDGILHTSDLLLNGVAAKVKLDGSVDLSEETQDLNVHVQPSLTDGLSMGAAGASILLMTNPVGAAAVGIGALVGQMALDNPVEKMFSYEYTVKGPWSEPIVEKKSGGGLRGAVTRTLPQKQAADAPSTTPSSKENSPAH